jgi:hypothetical protein
MCKNINILVHDYLELLDMIYLCIGKFNISIKIVTFFINMGGITIS